MTFNEKLRDIATKGGEIPYIYGTPSEVDHISNQLHKSLTYPVCVHITSVSGVLRTYPGAMDERQVLIGFADKMGFKEFKEGAVQKKVDALREAAFAFIDRLNNDGHFEPVEEVNYTVTFDDDSANFVMVLLDFTLKEAVSHCLMD